MQWGFEGPLSPSNKGGEARTLPPSPPRTPNQRFNTNVRWSDRHVFASRLLSAALCCRSAEFTASLVTLLRAAEHSSLLEAWRAVRHASLAWSSVIVNLVLVRTLELLVGDAAWRYVCTHASTARQLNLAPSQVPRGVLPALGFCICACAAKKLRRNNHHHRYVWCSNLYIR